MSQDISTKEKIIRAAKELFLEQGFAGASMGRIAKLAGVNHSLLFYHFKTKENLWAEVKYYIAGHDTKISKLLPDHNLKFDDFLKELFHNSINFYSNNPEVIRMLNWQRLESKGNPGVGMTLTSEMEKWIAVLYDYQRNGEIKSDIKPEFIITIILSVASSTALDNYFFISDDKSLEAYIDFCCESILKTVKIGCS